MSGAFNVLILIIIFPLSKCAVPGKYFWRPRLAIDLGSPETAEHVELEHNFTYANIRDGNVALVKGYDVAMSVLALASGLSNHKQLPSLTPSSAQYYTNIYRWTLRHLSLIPYWLGGPAGGSISYPDTQKVWRRRFFYMDDFVPEWMTPLLRPFVSQEEWVKEKKLSARYSLYAEPSFGKDYRYPSNTFNDFASQKSEPTAENLDSSFEER